MVFVLRGGGRGENEKQSYDGELLHCLSSNFTMLESPSKRVSASE